MGDKPLVSIIIRTKNEERWISQCLKSVFAQNYKKFEVVIVDNESSDKTVDRARQFPVAGIVACSEYRPGKAINLGVRASRGDVIVCLSGHCIPVNEGWLGHLIGAFTDESIAGVYGRQEPMSFTPDSDKRDLALVFGMDKKIQEKDSFFHNANSAVLRKVWEKTPFSETVTNIEDRVWAKEVLGQGYKIVYEPEASVYHYHGIHQDGSTERCANVVRIMETLHGGAYQSVDLLHANVISLIPIKGPVEFVNNKPLLEYTVKRSMESKYIKRTIVATDDQELASLARGMGAETPFLRDSSFSEEHVDLNKVLKYSLDRLESCGIYPDIIVPLEATFPFRPKGFLDDMIAHLAREGFDSVIAVRRENKSIWKQENGRIVQVDEGIMPRKFKDPNFIGLKGLGCVTHPGFLRQGGLLGQKLGMYEVTNPCCSLEVRSPEDKAMASPLLEDWFKQ